MGATTVNAAVTQLSPIGGTTNSGIKIGYLATADKAAQNDIVKITNATKVLHADIRLVSTGAAETYTLSGNSITCTSATTSVAIRGIILYI